MSWNFPRNEKLMADIHKMNRQAKIDRKVSQSVDARRKKGVEPCQLDINKNAHTDLLGEKNGNTDRN